MDVIGLTRIHKNLFLFCNLDKFYLTYFKKEVLHLNYARLRVRTLLHLELLDRKIWLEDNPVTTFTYSLEMKNECEAGIRRSYKDNRTDNSRQADRP